jgi:DnaJ-class molecular chaperone
MTMIPPHIHGPQPEDELDDYGLRECPDCDGMGEVDPDTGEPVRYNGEECPTCEGTGKVRI